MEDKKKESRQQTPVHDVGEISRRLVQAKIDEMYWHDRWQEFAFAQVSVVDIRTALKAIEDAQWRLGVAQSLMRRWRAEALPYWILKYTRASECGATVSGLVVSVILILAAAPLIILERQLIAILLTLGFLLGISWFAASLLIARHLRHDENELLKTLGERMGRSAAKIVDCQLQIRELQNAHALLLLQRKTEGAYYQAQEIRIAIEKELEATERSLQLQRHLLAHSNWKALRDVEFENFVAEIFRLLGYTVEATKATGDQGVDLVVQGKARKIAVQVKGYEGSVGNKAVQEAYAGREFYSCSECVVVTNSKFTRAAVELATKVGCKLIDESEIVPFIEGRHY